MDREIDIYRAALEKWGPESQTLMMFEEMSELQKELCKAARGMSSQTSIAEEIADVQIMLAQMVLLHDCAELAREWKDYKLKRLWDELNTENWPVTRLAPGNLPESTGRYSNAKKS